MYKINFKEHLYSYFAKYCHGIIREIEIEIFFKNNHIHYKRRYQGTTYQSILKYNFFSLKENISDNCSILSNSKWKHYLCSCPNVTVTR